VSSGQRVAVVTGGGGGIGAAIAEELGRGGWFVVTVDPLVTVDGTAQLPDPEETTAGRIVAAGGSARASSASVTDGPAIQSLFEELVADKGRLDAVVNVAGITRPTGFGRGDEEAWRAVVGVHLGGYLNVLEAALPIMAAAGRGRILGVTSGSGWRAADAGAYSWAKRAVASLTWQLGRHAPPGVTVNAMSPIAATRMVAGALARAATSAAPAASEAAGRTGSSGGVATGGLSLASMPTPEALGPIGAYMVGDGFAWCNGRVLFTAGSEVAIIDEPKLLEVTATAGAASLDHLLGTVLPRAFVPAEEKQASQGGANARFPATFSEALAAPLGPSAEVRSCAVVTDRPLVAEAVKAALDTRSIACFPVAAVSGFAAASDALQSVADPLDAVVVALSSPAEPAVAAHHGWSRILAEHRGLVDAIHTDSSWCRAAADYAGAAGRPLRLVVLSDATTAGGRSRAQAVAQSARIATSSTKGAVSAFAVSVEATDGEVASVLGPFAGHLLTGDECAPLAGAELVAGSGWVGLRSHPWPAASVAYPGPAVPHWLDAVLAEAAGVTVPAGPAEGR
jgi:NAD(P)-dependent dehydrogenase (short-subunit alcohol dehydrogenase family)